ncbi:hypothetical protein FOM45_25360, partial [Salmonella enterica]|nr:hypothetical protein [Salmonella enterica]
MKPLFAVNTATLAIIISLGTQSSWGGGLDGGTAKGNGVAIGSGASSSDWSVAIGDNAKTDGYGSVVIGMDAKTGRLYSVAIGHTANAGDRDGNVAIGTSATVESGVGDSVALGHNSKATRSHDVSIGGAGGTRTLSNLSDGTEANDAVNVQQLNTAKNNAVATANEHTNAEITALDGKARGYADGAKDAAISAANTHTNTEITALDGKARGYADGAKDAAISAANTHTDT